MAGRASGRMMSFRTIRLRNVIWTLDPSSEQRMSLDLDLDPLPLSQVGLWKEIEVV